MAASSIAKRKIARAASSLAIGDERVPRGSVSELQHMLLELESIISGASALVEADEMNMTWVEYPVAAAAELLKLAIVRCEQLGELIQPEVANG